ncbi:hypothetical protein ACOSP7_032057 [Xanthoceras sorbifolium]
MSQALGGYQNAHKREHVLAKRRQGIDLGVFAHPNLSYYPKNNSSFSEHSFYASSSFTRSPLDVRMDSMINKPSYPWHSPGYRFVLDVGGNGGMDSMINKPSYPWHSPGYRFVLDVGGNGGWFRQGMVSPQPYSHNSFQYLNSGFGISTFSLRIKENNPPGFANIQTSNDSSNFDNDQDASGLDLSLKL